MEKKRNEYESVHECTLKPLLLLSLEEEIVKVLLKYCANTHTTPEQRIAITPSKVLSNYQTTTPYIHGNNTATCSHTAN